MSYPDDLPEPPDAPASVPAPIIPFQVIRGEASGVAVAPATLSQPLDRREPPSDDTDRVVVADATVRDSTIKLGQIEAQILDLAGQKIAIYRDLLGHRTVLQDALRTAARHAGIDPDSTQSWTLDIAQRVFLRLR